MREEVIVHFRKEERPFVERMAEWVELVDRTSTPRQTDFLDPRQHFILQTITNRFPDLLLYSDGGYTYAERKKVIIVPSYIPFVRDDVDISLLFIKADHRFHALTHGDYMGALLNLGIKRDKFGDILVQPEGAQIIVATEIAGFIMNNLQQVHRQSVSITNIPFLDIVIPSQLYEEASFTVMSLRLDAILSESYNLSRSKVLPLIRSGKCKVNWAVTDNVSMLIQEGDTLSLQGFGRCK
ncbi:MAG: YlmH/Sll1252 family protein, partial [Bacilli bacterium]